MKIPKTIFQTWKDNDVPSAFQEFQETWKYHHPQFDFVLWTDEMNRAFVLEEYPDFIDIYDDYEFVIQRADAIRYLFLYHFGGVYVDLDIECLKSIVPLVSNLSCFFGTENEGHNLLHSKDRIISNAIMGCVPRHPLMGEIIDYLFTSEDKHLPKNDRILNSTGPFMLDAVIKNTHSKDFLLLDAMYVSPLDYKDAERHCQDGGHKVEQTKNAYCIHYHWGTWWKGDK